MSAKRWRLWLKKKYPNQQSYQTGSERISWFDEIIQFQLGHINRIRVLVSVDIDTKWPWDCGEYLPFNLQIDVEIKCLI